MASVTLENVKKVYDDSFIAVQDVNLKIKNGEFVVLVGPSGCGKSTTLRMIAGLEDISEGKVFIDDLLVNKIEANERDIAMVFQSYALYPHMNVLENIQFGIRIRGKDRELCEETALEAANVLGLEQYLGRYPKQLSGGQRQRVALGRSIVRNAKVILMDEPLSNLDAELRAKMRVELRRIHNKYKNTTIYVTHDQTEAMTMADRIVVMDKGFIQQVNTPIELYNNPINKFVAGFIGLPTMNFMDVKIKNNILTTSTGDSFKLTDQYEDEEYILGIRPSDVSLKEVESSLKIKLTSDFTEIHGSGNITRGIYSNNDFNFMSQNYYEINEEVELFVPLSKAYLFNTETEVRVNLKLK
ncbi:MAG: ATP-binding cassette domain-containing protein [Acholeplasmataceae bacterium]|nr:ATP-binding cassette domain-containing protein [Acholeplasmataceae bacterium]